MPVTDRRVRIMRSPSALALNTALVLGVPVLAIGWIVLQGSIAHHEESVLAAAIIGAVVGVPGGIWVWWDRAAARYSLRGSTLRVKGRDGGEVDLASARFAWIVRDERKAKPTTVVRLQLESPGRPRVTVKLGDAWLLSELSADSLHAVADELDRPTAPEPVHETAQWLRDYADHPRASVWPEE